MHGRFFSATSLFFLVIALVPSLAGQTIAQKSDDEITFTVSMPKPHTHLFEVELRIKRKPGALPKQELLIMPVWTPGSYMIREFARHVQDFSASDVTGKPLPWEKTDKNSWRVETGGLAEWHVSYRVYANELSVRTNELNTDHAFWNNAALLMYPDGLLNAPSVLRVLAPEPWRVATGLPAVPGQKNAFRAENFDVLYDSPVEASNFKTIPFEVKGVPHRVVIDGVGNYDPERMRTDIKKIVEAEIEIMGGEVPYRDYTFILHLREYSGGALEHLNSTAINSPRFTFKSEASYRGFLDAVAHEFFHLWNVKRIRPDALGPFDYTKENYTKLLWVAEGVTSYYATIILRRAGLISDTEFLASAASAFQGLQNRPGRLVMSAEDASFDAWIKYYRQDENSANSQIDYYDKGAILGLLLDLEIRKQSKAAKSLDDVMRALYRDFFKKDRNYTPEDFEKLSTTAAGTSLETFFAKYVRGREELDYNSALAAAGLRLETTDPLGKPAEKAWLGADLADENGRLMVKRVYAGSPAYEQGLNAGDQILALNNMRADKAFVEARIDEKRPGDPISLTIFRFDDLSTLLIRLGGHIDAPYRIIAIDNPSEEQKRIYKSWLGASFPSPRASAAQGD